MDLLSDCRQIYQKEPLKVKLHIWGRSSICPFTEMLAYFPASGSILDFGCGYGFLLHLLHRHPSNKGRSLLGIDHDAAKIELAGRYANSAVQFSRQGLPDLPAAAFDAVSIVDVLYSVKLQDWEAILADCRRILRPGGRLIIKEVVDRPHWRRRFTEFQEKLAIETFKITRGDRAHFESVETYSGAIRDKGFKIREIKALNSWHWSSQCIFIAEK